MASLTWMSGWLLVRVQESDNNVFGAARNPWGVKRTPGGSSGGEGAVIAAQGAPLGFGTDIGGSIRIPAHFCGIYGFKATPQRMTQMGLVRHGRAASALCALCSVLCALCSVLCALWFVASRSTVSDAVTARWLQACITVNRLCGNDAILQVAGPMGTLASSGLSRLRFLSCHLSVCLCARAFRDVRARSRAGAGGGVVQPRV